MIIDDYLNYQIEYKNKYGENTIILMQVGSFFEMYSINENCSFMTKIGDICNIIISKKNKSVKEVSKSNPLMAGFPIYVINKFIQILTENNFTIVLIEQITPPPNPERKITEIISPSTNINANTKKGNYIMVLYFEEMKDNLLIVGISGVDLTTGKCFVYESGAIKTDPQSTLDECYRLLTIYNPSEILILSENEIKNKNQIIEITNSINSLVHYKWNNYELFPIIKKLEYQNKILEKSFENSSMLSVCEYLNLERINYARISFCCLLQFAYEHNAEIIKELNNPEILEQSKILTIEYNSSLQLNIISHNENERPLLDILNRCSTAFGSRGFKEKLLNPINNVDELNRRYEKIEELLEDKKFKTINKYLNNINDLERSKRKILLKKFNPSEWSYLINSLENATEAFKIINKDIIINNINEILNYLKILNIDECNKYNIADINSNIFNKGHLPEIDDLTKLREEKFNVLISISEKISGIGDTICKLENNDKDGYYILITKKRYETAVNKNKKYMSKFEKKIISSNNNNLKLVSDEINEASLTIETIEQKIQSIVIKEYLNFLTKFLMENKGKLDIIINELTELDINNCNAKNAFDYCYYKPSIIQNSPNSFIKSENLRHPIIERIYNEIEYVGNDISLNQDGILLYGINSSGKSSFMKAVGLSIIMAQAGMFVPSTSFEYYPYNHIMTRICGNDNIYRGMSSFVVEMTELRNILQRADKSSLIIGDEICCGTEAISGISIVSAAIVELTNKKASFIFTSHLHELTDISIIKDKIAEDKLKIFHMHIEIDGDLIIYERKLREGQGSNIYGIDVCKSLDMPLNFMKNAELIKKEIMGLNTTIINTKTSNYNSSVFIDVCEVCKKNKSSETHHINYQVNANENGKFDNFNKNIQHNLIPICDECHKKEHNGNIGIIGYVMTNKGKKLEIENKSRINKLIKFENDNWFYRTRINAKWLPTTENEIVDFYNKQMKSTKTGAEISAEFI
uniref:DNA mismatch repair proteins mutS family domain-containing protein n=1 Tax=viral metagenome TaxID=1070528 RepID=A0A6C0LJ09_9ZZZZ